MAAEFAQNDLIPTTQNVNGRDVLLGQSVIEPFRGYGNDRLWEDGDRGEWQGGDRNKQERLLGRRDSYLSRVAAPTLPPDFPGGGRFGGTQSVVAASEAARLRGFGAINYYTSFPAAAGNRITAPRGMYTGLGARVPATGAQADPLLAHPELHPPLNPKTDHWIDPRVDPRVDSPKVTLPNLEVTGNHFLPDAAEMLRGMHADQQRFEGLSPQVRDAVNGAAEQAATVAQQEAAAAKLAAKNGESRTAVTVPSADALLQANLSAMHPDVTRALPTPDELLNMRANAQRFASFPAELRGLTRNEPTEAHLQD
ncbi:MAG: hypothetical protein ACREQ5_11000, partial [Candidatus Dormibacteria bacterium]